MSYHVYQTKGFVLGSAPLGEAHKSYTVYTRDMGLIFASAQGIRLTQSKLRYSIDDYKLTLFALVRGREVWRITNAREGEGSPLSGKRLVLFARAASLVRRLLHGEEKNEYLFDSLESLYLYLSQTAVSSQNLSTLEILVVLRCLYALGYVNGSVFEEYVSTTLVDESLLDSFSSHKKQAVSAINKALEESHL
ncbi:MAG TPA: recombination protein O N-terminal domain-containing protein [Candidatus Paceibacterota bacterium]|nr:recombination protein O N-terminal domain-containing protein [Candidatus Paceibacterota bacterium]